MAALAVGGNVVVITCAAKTLGLCLDERKLNVLEPPGLKGQNADKPENEGPEISETKECPAHVVCASLSVCNKLLVLCSNNKQLSIWDVNSWSLISNRVLARTASKVKFTPSGHAVVVADKSGDAYLYSVEVPNAGGELLLGHLSMLLDIIITNDEKYIITCDRDEKIRVSRFPNAYNIHSYCLGHTEFVSCLALLPHCSSILISGSGDGTLRLWDYARGFQINMIQCNRKMVTGYNNKEKTSSLVCTSVSSDVSNDNNGGMLDYKVDGEDSVAVTFISGCSLDYTTSLIGVGLSTFEGCAIFKITGEVSRISSSLIQTLSFGVEPWDVFLTKTLLWCLIPMKNKPLLVFEFNCALGKYDSLSTDSDDSVEKATCLINDQWNLFKNISAPTLTPILYKRSIDNVQEYKERKKVRLASKIS